LRLGVLSEAGVRNQPSTSFVGGRETTANAVGLRSSKLGTSASCASAEWDMAHAKTRRREEEGSNGVVSRSRSTREDDYRRLPSRCRVAGLQRRRVQIRSRWRCMPPAWLSGHRGPAPEARQKIGPGVSPGSSIPRGPSPSGATDSRCASCVARSDRTGRTPLSLRAAVGTHVCKASPRWSLVLSAFRWEDRTNKAAKGKGHGGTVEGS